MDSLPRSVTEMTDIIGLTAALALVESYPGIAFRVPIRGERGRTRARLVQLMGVSAAEKFIRHYGGEILAVPRCVAAMRAARDQRLIDDYTAGQTSEQIARKYAITQRHVWRVLKRTPEVVHGVGDRQLRLF
jgi:hypothetical protein